MFWLGLCDEVGRSGKVVILKQFRLSPLNRVVMQKSGRLRSRSGGVMRKFGSLRSRFRGVRWNQFSLNISWAASDIGEGDA